MTEEQKLLRLKAGYNQHATYFTTTLNLITGIGTAAAPQNAIKFKPSLWGNRSSLSPVCPNVQLSSLAPCAFHLFQSRASSESKDNGIQDGKPVPTNYFSQQFLFYPFVSFQERKKFFSKFLKKIEAH